MLLLLVVVVVVVVLLLLLLFSLRWYVLKYVLGETINLSLIHI